MLVLPIRHAGGQDQATGQAAQQGNARISTGHRTNVVVAAHGDITIPFPADDSALRSQPKGCSHQQARHPLQVDLPIMFATMSGFIFRQCAEGGETPLNDGAGPSSPKMNLFRKSRVTLRICWIIAAAALVKALIITLMSCLQREKARHEHKHDDNWCVAISTHAFPGLSIFFWKATRSGSSST
jgi:hypothetical protein